MCRPFRSNGDSGLASERPNCGSREPSPIDLWVLLSQMLALPDSRPTDRERNSLAKNPRGPLGLGPLARRSGLEGERTRFQHSASGSVYREYKLMLRVAGLPSDVRFHDLRVIMEPLGHSSIHLPSTPRPSRRTPAQTAQGAFCTSTRTARSTCTGCQCRGR